MAEQQKQQQGKQQGKSRQKSGPLEILATILSTLILLFAMGFLVWEGLKPLREPGFDVTIGDVRQTGQRYFMPLQIRNTGTRSVESLDLTVVLTRNGEAVAESSTSVPWLPAQSIREAVVGFDRDPREHDVQVNIDGYSVP